MKIFLSFLQSKRNYAIPAYSFWEFYLKNGIKEHGSEYVESDVDWAEGLCYFNDSNKLGEWKSEVWTRVIRDIKKIHSRNGIDIFLSYLYPFQVDESAIKEIQKLGIPCVNFFCDNVREFTTIPNSYKIFDLNWVPEFHALKMYKSAGYNYMHLPMPMWVEPKFRNLPENENNCITFIGSKDIQRLLLFEKLIEKNIDFELYGSGWNNSPNYSFNSTNKFLLKDKIINQLNFIKTNGISGFFRKIAQNRINQIPSDELLKRIGNKPDFEQYTKLTRESTVTLGVNRYPSYRYPLNKPDKYSRLRDIEAPMLGACYLTENCEDIHSLYPESDTIETYNSIDELVEKINELQRNKFRRNLLRSNGQKYALNKLSISNSINNIKEKFQI